jgi:hypothetical protein
MARVNPEHVPRGLAERHPPKALVQLLYVSIKPRRTRVFLEDWNGGASRDRTDDLIVANDALSQLSYSPTAFGINFYLDFTSAARLDKMSVPHRGNVKLPLEKLEESGCCPRRNASRISSATFSARH